jgi:hypothetical protein
MVKDIKRITYFEFAYPALRKIIEGILELAEAESYLGEDGYFELPMYFRERITKLRDVITRVREPEKASEIEVFLNCFDSGDFSPILKRRERELDVWYIGARAYEREKAKRQRG